MNIRKLTETQKPAAMELAWRVFQEFEAPEYAPEGVQAFHDYITAPAAPISPCFSWTRTITGREWGRH